MNNYFESINQSELFIIIIDYVKIILNNDHQKCALIWNPFQSILRIHKAMYSIPHLQDNINIQNHTIYIQYAKAKKASRVVL